MLELACLEEGGDGAFALVTLHALFLAIGRNDCFGSTAGGRGANPDNFAFRTHDGILAFRWCISG